MQIDLPDGHTATIRDPRKIPGRLADLITDAEFALLAMPEADYLNTPEKAAEFNAKPFNEQVRLLGRETFAAMREQQYAKVAAYVESWSLPQPLTLDGVRDIPGDAFAAISEAIAKVEGVLGGPALDAPVDPDPASPSTPSNG